MQQPCDFLLSSLHQQVREISKASFKTILAKVAFLLKITTEE